MTFPEWGSSENCLSSRNSCPMNSMGMPGAVISRPVATRLRLRAYQERESDASAKRGMRCPSPRLMMSWFSTHCTDCQRAGSRCDSNAPAIRPISTEAFHPLAACAIASRTASRSLATVLSSKASMTNWQVGNRKS